MPSAEDIGLFRAGGGVGVARLAAHAAGGEPGEGGGFHPLRRQVELVGGGGADAERGEPIGEFGHQHGVEHAAAGKHFAHARGMGGNGVGDALCGEGVEGAYDIGGGIAVF